MSADRWEYVAVSRCRAEKFQDVSPVFDVEARYRPERAHQPDPRVVITAVWDSDLPDALLALQVLIDGGDESTVEGFTLLPTSAALMRTIPYARLLRQALTELEEQDNNMQIVENRNLSDVQELPNFAELRKEWPKGDTREVAKWAGYVYMKAVADGEASTKAVAESFGVSRSTAKRMIALAREQEFIAAHVVGAPGSR